MKWDFVVGLRVLTAVSDEDHDYMIDIIQISYWLFHPRGNVIYIIFWDVVLQIVDICFHCQFCQLYFFNGFVINDFFLRLYYLIYFPEYYSPISEYYSPISKYRSPISEYYSPISEYHSPISEYYSPISEYRSPISKYYSPISEYHSPISEYHSPISEYYSPISEYHHSCITPRNRRRLLNGTLSAKNSTGKDSVKASYFPHALTDSALKVQNDTPCTRLDCCRHVHTLCQFLPDPVIAARFHLFGELAVGPLRLTVSAPHKSGGTLSQIPTTSTYTRVFWICGLCHKQTTGQVGLVVGSWPSNRATEGSTPKGTRLYFVILLKNVEKIFDWHWYNRLKDALMFRKIFIFFVTNNKQKNKPQSDVYSHTLG